MPKQKTVIALLVAFIVAIISFPAASAIFFGIVGRTPADPEWLQTVVVLAISMTSTITLLLGFSTIVKSLLLKKILRTFSAFVSSVWIGLYYGEVLAGKSDRAVAIVFTIATILSIALFSFFRSGRLMSILILAMGMVFTYGLAFVSATATFAFLSTEHFLPGAIWGICSLAIIASTIVLISFLTESIQS
jgi:hypothetical protein